MSVAICISIILMILLEMDINIFPNLKTKIKLRGEVK